VNAANAAVNAEPQPLQSEVCRRRAEVFVEVLGAIAPHVELDYSPTSLLALEGFLCEAFDPPGSVEVGPNLPVDLGCYVGEVIVRAIGGSWSVEASGQIDDVGQIKALWPIQKAFKRFQNGPADSLAFYYGRIADHAQGGFEAA
jgi:hypothetical protein